MNLLPFVTWFRQVSPYIHTHRGRTFVIGVGGEAALSPHFSSLLHDIALMNSLGIRLVLVHGIRPQIEQHLKVRGLPSHYVKGLRVTDGATLNCVKAAWGEVRSDIESALSKGLTNHPASDMRINIASGNFIVARPVGVREGVDYGYTGEVRRVEVAAMTRRLDEGCIVLLGPIGYSPTGETFNLLTEDVATEVAIALGANKLICLVESKGILDEQDQLIRELTVEEAQRLLSEVGLAQTGSERSRWLTNAIRACQQGVQRVHLVSWQVEGALLLELFTRDGSGTLMSVDSFEHLRKATIEDVGGILELIRPLEEAGILVRRSREKLETEISYFTVQERDGMIIACAALYPFQAEGMAELACLAVHPNYRKRHRGDALLAFLEREARYLGMTNLFVLTTRAAHWFQERGFVEAELESLPMTRRALYNYQRKSKVFVKGL